MKSKAIFSCALIILITLISFNAYAYVGDAYVTPDTWSRHVNANGIKASINGLDFGVIYSPFFILSITLY